MDKSLRIVSDDDPTEIWRGVAPINLHGAQIAFDMLCELESGEAEDEIEPSDFACLKDWPREALPFRNVVLEALTRARAAGPDAESGFCAVLTDLVAFNCSGSTVGAERYAGLYDLKAD